MFGVVEMLAKGVSRERANSLAPWISGPWRQELVPSAILNTYIVTWGANSKRPIQQKVTRRVSVLALRAQNRAPVLAAAGATGLDRGQFSGGG